MIFFDATISQWIIGLILILSSLGVIAAKKPVHASLSFLLTLLMLAALYLQLSAGFIAVMQVLVYAGAIMVLFMYVIVLFQDAYQQIAKFEAQSSPNLIMIAGTAFVLALLFLGQRVLSLPPSSKPLPDDFGTVEALGRALYLDFFFPFEAIIFLFLIAVIGALYIARKEKRIGAKK